MELKIDVEDIARKAFMAYYNYKNIEDWDRLPETREKWIKVTQAVLEELKEQQIINQ